MAEQNTKSDLKYCLEIARGDDSLCGFLASGEKIFFSICLSGAATMRQHCNKRDLIRTGQVILINLTITWSE